MDIDTKQVEIEVLKNWVQNLDSKLSSALTDIDTLTQKLNKTDTMLKAYIARKE